MYADDVEEVAYCVSRLKAASVSASGSVRRLRDTDGLVNMDEKVGSGWLRLA